MVLREFTETVLQKGLEPLDFRQLILMIDGSANNKPSIVIFFKDAYLEKLKPVFYIILVSDTINGF